MDKFRLNSKDLIYLILILLTGAFSVYQFVQTKEKIGFIKTSEVLNNYKGMIQVKSEININTKKWQSSIDTMEFAYKTALDNYRLEEGKLSSVDKQHRIEQLTSMENELKDYVGAVQERNNTESQKIIQGVANQVNAYVKEFAEKNNFKLILGTTTDGNIMYGSDAIDVTNEVIKGINEAYK